MGMGILQDQETEGKRPMREREGTRAAGNGIKKYKPNPPGWLLKSPPFAGGFCPGEVLLAGKDPPVPGLHLKHKNKQTKLCFGLAVRVAGGFLSFVYLDNYLGF